MFLSLHKDENKSFEGFVVQRYGNVCSLPKTSQSLCVYNTHGDAKDPRFGPW